MLPLASYFFTHTFFCWATKESMQRKTPLPIAIDVSVPRRVHNGLPRLL